MKLSLHQLRVHEEVLAQAILDLQCEPVQEMVVSVALPNIDVVDRHYDSTPAETVIEH